jgi:bacteriorhodopsin
MVQLLIALVTGTGLFIDIPSAVRNDLRAIFALELASQVVEMVWYTVVVCRYRVILTWTRYIDWVISTPVMLLSTILFFRLRQGLPLGEVWRDWRVYLVLGLDETMLLFGFFMERGVLSPLTGLTLGGAAFVGVFTALAALLEASDSLSLGLYIAMYVVWGLYGVAAAFGDTVKNVSYNALDIVSKNFYGVFLFVYALTLVTPAT